MKKLLALSLATGVVGAGLLANVSAFAAEQPAEQPHNTVKVSYSSSVGIPDPDDPENPDYVISIPAAIVFSDEKNSVDASVEMTNLDGTAYAGEKQADVSVTSKNQFKLKNGSREVNYDLKYGQNIMSVTNTKVGTLSKTNLKVKGSADLQGSATATGNYTDVLTYNVVNK